VEQGVPQGVLLGEDGVVLLNKVKSKMDALLGAEVCQEVGVGGRPGLEQPGDGLVQLADVQPLEERLQEVLHVDGHREGGLHILVLRRHLELEAVLGPLDRLVRPGLEVPD